MLLPMVDSSSKIMVEYFSGIRTKEVKNTIFQFLIREISAIIIIKQREYSELLKSSLELFVLGEDMQKYSMRAKKRG